MHEQAVHTGEQCWERGCERDTLRGQAQTLRAELTTLPDGALPLPCSDLKGANVLIKSGKATAKDPRGFVCKLADFGLARVLGSNRTHVSTSTHGARPISAKPRPRALPTLAASASSCWEDSPAMVITEARPSHVDTSEGAQAFD